MSGFVLYVLGVSYISVALVLLAFAGLALAWGEDPRGFALAAAVGLALGGVLRARGTPKAEPRRAEGLFTVGVLWILVPLLGAIPYWVSGHLNYLDALFESVSGFTTTGATILDDFSKFNKSLFLWRGLTQWFGGIGIIVLFIAVLPHFAVAGRQLFFVGGHGRAKG